MYHVSRSRASVVVEEKWTLGYVWYDPPRGARPWWRNARRIQQSVNRRRSAHCVTCGWRNAHPSGIVPRWEEWPSAHPYAAGIDIGLRFHVMDVPLPLYTESVCTYRSFTKDWPRMADWLVELGSTTMALESTGLSCSLLPLPSV